MIVFDQLLHTHTQAKSTVHTTMYNQLIEQNLINRSMWALKCSLTPVNGNLTPAKGTDVFQVSSTRIPPFSCKRTWSRVRFESDARLSNRDCSRRVAFETDRDWRRFAAACDCNRGARARIDSRPCCSTCNSPPDSLRRTGPSCEREDGERFRRNTVRNRRRRFGERGIVRWLRSCSDALLARRTKQLQRAGVQMLVQILHGRERPPRRRREEAEQRRRSL